MVLDAAGPSQTYSPSDPLTLVLPLPPSINHQYATVNGRRVLSRDGRTFKAAVADEVEAWVDQEPQANALMALFQRRYLVLTITFYFVSALRRDLDSGLKIAQDALCEALGVNDNLVVEIHLKKRVDRQNPRSEVCLEALPPEALDLGVGKSPATGDTTQDTLPPTPRSAHRPKRRGWRKQRSLEELATRHRWD